MRFSRLIRVVLFLGLFAMAVRVSADTDSFWHLRAGTWMLEQKEILRADPFSLTRNGESWIYPGWLAQVGMALLYQGLGYAGLNLLVAFMVVAAFWWIWRSITGPELWRAFVIVLGAAVSGVYWSARPQILSFALAGLWIYYLERIRAKRTQRSWILPLSMILWVNLHGGFAIGFILLGVYGAGEIVEVGRDWLQNSTSWRSAWNDHRERILHMILLGVLSLAAVCLNPHGPIMLLYPLKTVSIGALQDYIAEWQSPNFHMRESQPFLWMFMLTWLALATSKRRAHATELIALIAFGYLGFTASRNVALLGLIAAPVLARHGYSSLQPIIDRIPPGRDLSPKLAHSLNLVLAILVAGAVLLKVSVPLMTETNLEELESRHPTAAIEFILRERPPGPLFNSYNWGGYVTWALFPHYLSFVDGRTDLFGDEILSQYIQVWRADPEWQQILDAWDVHLALVETAAPIAKVMLYEGWDVLYQDSEAIVLGHP